MRRAAVTIGVIIVLVLVLVTHQGQPVRSQDAGLTPVAYLPIVEVEGPTQAPTATPTSTATATSTRTPTATNTPTQTPIPVELLPNGDFEQGKTIWETQESANLVITDTLLAPVRPRSGAWVGRFTASQNGADGTEIMSPSITVPADRPYLGYWYWIRSTEGDCLDDVGGAVLVQDPSVQTRHALCMATQTDGWVRVSLDLTDYAGETIEILLLAGTFDTNEPDSFLYIDDIGFQAVP